MEFYIFKSTEGGKIIIFLLFIGIRYLYKYLPYIPIHNTNDKLKPCQTNTNQHTDNRHNSSILPLQTLKQNYIEPYKKASTPIKAQNTTSPKLNATPHKKAYATHKTLTSKKKALLAYELFKRKYESF